MKKNCVGDLQLTGNSFDFLFPSNNNTQAVSDLAINSHYCHASTNVKYLELMKENNLQLERVPTQH